MVTMPTLQELSAKVDELQTALDTEQAEIQEVINGLNTTISDLHALVAQGGTEAERQAVLDKLTSLKDDLVATVTPTPGTGDGETGGGEGGAQG